MWKILCRRTRSICYQSWPIDAINKYCMVSSVFCFRLIISKLIHGSPLYASRINCEFPRYKAKGIRCFLVVGRKQNFMWVVQNVFRDERYWSTLTKLVLEREWKRWIAGETETDRKRENSKRTESLVDITKCRMYLWLTLIQF